MQRENPLGTGIPRMGGVLVCVFRGGDYNNVKFSSCDPPSCEINTKVPKFDANIT